MQTLSIKTEQIFRAAIARLAGKDSVTIGEPGRVFMPLHVEKVGAIRYAVITPDGQTMTESAPLYSFAHYYEQNGDMMRDPDIEIMDRGPGHMTPVSFWQDAPLVRDEVFTYDDNGTVTGYRPQILRSICSFCSLWARNLKEQQGLEA